MSDAALDRRKGTDRQGEGKAVLVPLRSDSIGFALDGKAARLVQAVCTNPHEQKKGCSEKAGWMRKFGGSQMLQEIIRGRLRTTESNRESGTRISPFAGRRQV